MTFVWKCLLMFLSAIVLSIPAVLAGEKDHPKFEVSPATTYSQHQTQDNLTLAAIPYVSAEQSEKAFGKANLYSAGVLPILLVMQNATGKALRLDLQVQLIYPDGKQVEATPARDVPYLHGPKEPNMPNDSSRFPKIMKKKNPLMTWEVEGRAFSVKMLPAGESANGFFYFQGNYRPGSKLYVNGIREAASGKEFFYFEVPLELR